MSERERGVGGLHQLVISGILPLTISFYWKYIQQSVI